MKEWKIKSKRKDPDSGMRCKICKGIPTRWYKLMSTTIYRCEEHKQMIMSPVYDQGRISNRGELIGMEINPTFEVGISKVCEYGEKSGQPIDPIGLDKELRSCTDEIEHERIEKTDPDFVKKVRKFIEHVKIKHPLMYSYTTYFDEKGEHNLYLEHPDEFYLTQLSSDEIHDQFIKPIPRDLIGTDVSAEQIKRGSL